MNQQVEVGVKSNFTPVIDLGSGIADLQVAKQFEFARTDVDNSFAQRAGEMIKSKASEKKLKFGMSVVGAVALGFVAMQILGYLIAAGISILALGGLWYFWEYKLPTIIANAKSELIAQARFAANCEKENLLQIEIDFLKKLSSQAEKNPIETLQMELNVMDGERQAIASANTIIRAQQKVLEGDLVASKKDNPGADFSNEEQQLGDLKIACNHDDQELTAFVQAIEQMKKVINEARSKWNFAIKMDAALTARDKARGNEAQRKILADTALDSVKQKNAELFARIRTRAVELSAAKTITVGSTTIDVSSVKLLNPTKE